LKFFFLLDYLFFPFPLTSLLSIPSHLSILNITSAITTSQKILNCTQYRDNNNTNGNKKFHDKQKLKQYVTTKPLLQKILQGILHTESETQHKHERTGSTKLQEKKKQESRE
jgi:hypothetical protein